MPRRTIGWTLDAAVEPRRARSWYLQDEFKFFTSALVIKARHIWSRTYQVKGQASLVSSSWGLWFSQWLLQLLEVHQEGPVQYLCLNQEGQDKVLCPQERWTVKLRSLHPQQYEFKTIVFRQVFTTVFGLYVQNEWPLNLSWKLYQLEPWPN